MILDSKIEQAKVLSIVRGNDAIAKSLVLDDYNALVKLCGKRGDVHSINLILELCKKNGQFAVSTSGSGDSIIRESIALNSLTNTAILALCQPLSKFNDFPNTDFDLFSINENTNNSQPLLRIGAQFVRCSWKSSNISLSSRVMNTSINISQALNMHLRLSVDSFVKLLSCTRLLDSNGFEFLKRIAHWTKSPSSLLAPAEIDVVMTAYLKSLCFAAFDVGANETSSPVFLHNKSFYRKLQPINIQLILNELLASFPAKINGKKNTNLSLEKRKLVIAGLVSCVRCMSSLSKKRDDGACVGLLDGIMNDYFPTDLESSLMSQKALVARCYLKFSGSTEVGLNIAESIAKDSRVSLAVRFRLVSFILSGTKSNLTTVFTRIIPQLPPCDYSDGGYDAAYQNVEKLLAAWHHAKKYQSFRAKNAAEASDGLGDSDLLDVIIDNYRKYSSSTRVTSDSDDCVNSDEDLKMINLIFKTSFQGISDDSFSTSSSYLVKLYGLLMTDHIIMSRPFRNNIQAIDLLDIAHNQANIIRCKPEHFGMRKDETRVLADDVTLSKAIFFLTPQLLERLLHKLLIWSNDVRKETSHILRENYMSHDRDSLAIWSIEMHHHLSRDLDVLVKHFYSSLIPENQLLKSLSLEMMRDVEVVETEVEMQQKSYFAATFLNYLMIHAAAFDHDVRGDSLIRNAVLYGDATIPKFDIRSRGHWVRKTREDYEEEEAAASGTNNDVDAELQEVMVVNDEFFDEQASNKRFETKRSVSTKKHRFGIVSLLHKYLGMHATSPDLYPRIPQTVFASVADAISEKWVLGNESTSLNDLNLIGSLLSPEKQQQSTMPSAEIAETVANWLIVEYVRCGYDIAECCDPSVSQDSFTKYSQFLTSLMTLLSRKMYTGSRDLPTTIVARQVEASNNAVNEMNRIMMKEMTTASGTRVEIPPALEPIIRLLNRVCNTLDSMAIDPLRFVDRIKSRVILRSLVWKCCLNCYPKLAVDIIERSLAQGPVMPSVCTPLVSWLGISGANIEAAEVAWKYACSLNGVDTTLIDTMLDVYIHSICPRPAETRSKTFSSKSFRSKPKQFCHDDVDEITTFIEDTYRQFGQNRDALPSDYALKELFFTISVKAREMNRGSPADQFMNGETLLKANFDPIEDSVNRIAELYKNAKPAAKLVFKRPFADFNPKIADTMLQYARSVYNADTSSSK